MQPLLQPAQPCTSAPSSKRGQGAGLEYGGAHRSHRLPSWGKASGVLGKASHMLCSCNAPFCPMFMSQVPYCNMCSHASLDNGPVAVLAKGLQHIMLLLVTELGHAAILVQLRGAALQHNLCCPLDMQSGIDDSVHAAGQGLEIQESTAEQGGHSSRQQEAEQRMLCLVGTSEQLMLLAAETVS